MTNFKRIFNGSKNSILTNRLSENVFPPLTVFWRVMPLAPEKTAGVYRKYKA